MTLTAEGATLLDFTNRMVREIKDLELNLKAGSSNLVGKLNIGLYESIAIYFWPGFFKEFCKAHPHLDLRLGTARSKVLMEKLNQQEFDIIVTIEPKPSRRVSVIPLYSDVFRFYGSKETFKKLSSSLKSSRRSDAGQINLDDVPFITFPTALSHNGETLEESLEKLGFKGAKFHDVESFEAAKEICAAGIGIGVLPTRVARSAVESKKLFQIALPGFDAEGFAKHQICMATLNESRSSRHVNAVMSALSHYLSEKS